MPSSDSKKKGHKLGCLFGRVEKMMVLDFDETCRVEYLGGVDFKNHIQKFLTKSILEISQPKVSKIEIERKKF